jgi:hypothetical protein
VQELQLLLKAEETQRQAAVAELAVAADDLRLVRAVVEQGRAGEGRAGQGKGATVGRQLRSGECS